MRVAGAGSSDLFLAETATGRKQRIYRGINEMAQTFVTVDDYAYFLQSLPSENTSARFGHPKLQPLALSVVDMTPFMLR